MKKLFGKLLLLAIPFLILYAAVALVDPYNYFDWFHILSYKEKERIAGPYNQALWRVIDFKHHCKPNILIGDSRAHLFDSSLIRKMTGEDFYIFTLPGGSLVEMIHAFWFADRNIKLKKVYMAVDLFHYNRFWDHNRISGALETLRNPLLYLSHRDVIDATRAVFTNAIMHKMASIGKPNMTKKEFWDYQLNVTAGKFYRYYAYPENLATELKKISRHCKDNNIELVFVILPNHVSTQKKIEQFGLSRARQKFRSDLKKLGPLIDFNYPNELTVNRDNFKDPFHFNSARIQRALIRQIWLEPRKQVTLRSHRNVHKRNSTRPL